MADWAELFSRGEAYRAAAKGIRRIQQELVDLHAVVPDEIIDRLLPAEHVLFNTASYASQQHEEFVRKAKQVSEVAQGSGDAYTDPACSRKGCAHRGSCGYGAP